MENSGGGDKKALSGAREGGMLLTVL